MSQAAPTASLARTFPSRVLEVSDECAGVRTFRLEVPGDFSFLPGMWVMVHFPGQPHPTRAYSIASSPFEKGAIEISLGKVGEFTERLFALRGGELLTLKGPYGKWVYRDDGRRAVLISGGTGITPFRSMCRYALARGLAGKFTVLYSSKTPADILYREELAAFARAGIKVYTTITRPGDADWDGPTGRLGIEVIEREVPEFAEASYYVCGPISLVDDMTQALQAKGIPRDRIHREKWGDY